MPFFLAYRAARLSCACVLLGCAVAPGHAAAHDDAALVRAAVAHGKVVPLPHILEIAQHRVPGEVLKVELEEISKRLGYQVKILTPDGRVREIALDARTGAILAVQDD